ncbi:MAG: APC family permease [Bryobacteraceae bacterium]
MSADLARRLGLADSVALVAGTVIGAGIFLTPNLVARQVSSEPVILGFWVLGAALSFFGALAYAELGAMMPATGGPYVFLRECFGPLAAFLCGWTMLLTVTSAAVGWLAVSFGLYLGHFLAIPDAWGRAVGAGTVALLTAVNYAGVAAGATVQKILTVLKVAGLVGLIAAAGLRGGAPPAPEPAGVTGSLGLALLACLVAYDGWVAFSLVIGEVRDPQRNVPRALGLGLAIVALLYVGANWAYLRVLSPAEVAASSRVGADAAERAIGPVGGSLISAVVLVSIVGSLNGWILAAPRLFFAQARDGLFFRWFAGVHPRHGTPARAIVFHSAWSITLVFTGSYTTLVSYAMFAAWAFYGLSVAGMMRLRMRDPHRARPYRSWGYPVAPALFCLVVAGLMINTLWTTPAPALASAALIAAGIPAYYLWTNFFTGARNSRSSIEPST